MTEPNQYTDTVTLVREVATASVSLRFKIADGVAEDLTAEYKNWKFQPSFVIIGYTKTPDSSDSDWRPSAALVKGPRRRADGSLSDKTRGEVKFSGWPSLDLNYTEDALPRWLVHLFIANMPVSDPIQPVGLLTAETSWETEAYEDDLSPSAQPFEV